MFMGFIYRIRIAIGILLGVPCVVGHDIEVSPRGLHIKGKNGLVSGVCFRDMKRGVTLIHEKQNSND